MAEWKETLNTLKDWVAKQDKRIQLLAIPKDDHDSVLKQRQEIEVRTPWLQNALRAERYARGC